ncbi:hypothetical protein JRO89_XS08G0129400 [Xanthoceras sorbifolium]|uniref:J domain-containing protein n=1 Tax=Xanthoceras sorbifolium TaxID=99658 RepID=A0ABQ8HPR3_9ROSI|nr:hypothetical protein JRO89_XS08G0129400 [Xanthoceras sorbifolium]
MLFSSSSTVLASPPVHSVKFKTSSPAPPRVRFYPPPTPATAKTTAAAAAATTAARSTSTEERRSTTTCLRPRRMASCGSLYEVLGIAMGATSQEIKTAYRRLARTCHPDVVAATYDSKDTSADEFIKIHTAYCTLSDPAKRAVYDQKLFRRSRPLTSSSGFSGYSGRSWETDQCW